MRECGTPEVPSLYALRKLQATLTRDLNMHTKSHTSPMGNKFYMNHPVDLLTLDWSNPLVRKFIQIYPDVAAVRQESWQSDKWLKEVPYDDLTPMWASWKTAPHVHFYIKELAQLSDGTFVIPMRYVCVEGVEHAEVYLVAYSETTKLFTIEAHTIVRIPVSRLKYNFRDLEAQGYKFEFLPGSPLWAQNMPNPVRLIAKGRPAFVIRIMPWSDDVSGNRSKQYNAHKNIYIANVSLPHRKLQQEYFVRFCSTSPDASSIEQFEALCEDIGPDTWRDAYDCELEQDIIFRILPHLLPADNPQQSEECSHSGGNANLGCRRDLSGGTAIEKETNDGYDALFSPGKCRTKHDTVLTIQKMLLAACGGVQDVVDKIQTETGVKDSIATFWIEKLITKAREMQKVKLTDLSTRDPRLNDHKVKGKARQAIILSLKHEIRDELFNWLLCQTPERYAQLPLDSPLRKQLRSGTHYNPLLNTDGIDPHPDTPCEILHSKLLGDDKYVWYETSHPWNKKNDEIFAARLQAASTDGLTIAPLRARYVVQYKNNLIGKHYKALQQLAVFQMRDDLCNRIMLDLWKATGEFGALLWYPEIRDIEMYLKDLQVLIDNALDVWALFDPRRIITKIKLHTFPHLVEDIRRFGPAILYSTEIFECWNAIFRMCSILSNHLAASRDIAVTLADMERFKHQVSGGWWKDSELGQYVRAGKRIRNFLEGNRELQRRLGWTDPTVVPIGSVKLPAQKHLTPMSWADALGSSRTDALAAVYDDPERLWVPAKHVISRSRDVCKERSWVFFQHGSQEDVVAGRIYKILVPHVESSAAINGGASNHHCTIVIEHFDIADRNDPRLNMPVLSSNPTRQALLVSPKDILFIFNAQHDCFSGGCTISNDVQTERQGRDNTTRTVNTVVHKDDSRFLLNMHALHNAHLIRSTLPRSLTEPKPYFQDRRAKHDEFATKLRITGPEKRAETAKKAQITRERNRKTEDVRRARLEGLPEPEASRDSGQVGGEVGLVIDSSELEAAS
ncbi:hypothetical protein PLICRDRAFT_120152 [Plicaturopsis crispa FD-325 SS-3]|uniref:Uncharacterized protein n=1 Tax=Plicaturopsis crispa FD-325 SS-3 TaxID=944288 RepID=A0A0C9T114_PLICR|nr:hypothetical protein PLICRDRAFT_120152 [Plicaturopsis crispa FD-325 SS-3]